MRYTLGWGLHISILAWRQARNLHRITARHPWYQWSREQFTLFPDYATENPIDCGCIKGVQECIHHKAIREDR